MVADGPGDEIEALAADRLRPYLGPDERLFWAGRPKSGIVFRRSDMDRMWPGGLVLFLAFEWLDRVLSLPGPPIAPVFLGLLFGGVGLQASVGRYLTDALRRSRIAYGLTNRRVLILESLRPARLVARDLGSLGPVTVTEGWHGRGTITFGTPVAPSVWTWAWPSAPRPPAFELIPGVRREAERAARSA
jgi:hypothetical protein